MERWDELLDVMRRLVKEEPETAAQILARLVTRFEVSLVVHQQKNVPMWTVSTSWIEGSAMPAETNCWTVSISESESESEAKPPETN